jgi:hypothetical protein
VTSSDERRRFAARPSPARVLTAWLRFAAHPLRRAQHAEAVHRMHLAALRSMGERHPLPG